MNYIIIIFIQYDDSINKKFNKNDFDFYLIHINSTKLKKKNIRLLRKKEFFFFFQNYILIIIKFYINFYLL